MDALEREERLLKQQLDNGEIDQAEYNRQWRDICGEYEYAAHEAAQRAYDDEVNNW